MAATRRLMRELAEFNEHKPFGAVAETESDNLYKWKIVFQGPPATPYEGGIFNISVEYPPKYPHEEPNLRMATKIYHPNVDPKDGRSCAGIEWNPAMKTWKIFEAIYNIIKTPNPESAVDTECASLMVSNKQEYTRKAREFTQLYAK